MAVYRGTTPLKAYKGDMQPVNVYKGSTKVAGWTLQSYSGASLDVTGTYEDSVDVTVSGNTVVHNGVFSSVEGKTLTCRTADGSRSSSVPMPTLRKVGTVADTYIPATGAYAKAISDVVTLDGSKPWAWSNSNSSYIAALITLSPKPLSTTALVTKYDGSVLPTPGGAPDRYVISPLSELYLALGYPDTGLNPTMTPTAAEIKAYFYGWRMCNADGSSPYTGGMKNWQHVTDGLGQTATLPTASYSGYTPYRMLYQLATPVTTTQTAKVMPTYRDETVIATDADAWCQPTLSATVKSIESAITSITQG